MITLPELASQDLGSFLASDTKDRFGSSHARLAEIIPFAARLALDCIGNSDALYHNVEHTMLVTLAGHEIFKGRALLMPVTPIDYSNFIVACLAHDIGYIRGIVKGDDAKGYVVDGTGCRADLPILRLRHIMLSGRSCLCWIALCQARSSTLQELRVRSDSQSADENEIDEEGALLRAADLIGQLGYPHYLRKANHRPFRNKELQG